MEDELSQTRIVKTKHYSGNVILILSSFHCFEFFNEYNAVIRLKHIADAKTLKGMQQMKNVPFSVIAVADSQRINVFSSVDNSFKGKVLCVKDQSNLNLENVYSDLINGKGKVITKTNNRFILNVNEMVNVKAVKCMYVFNDVKYAVVKVDVVKNAFGLPLETSFSIKEVYSRSVSIVVTTSYPSLVWCSASQTVPAITQLQKGQTQFVESKGIVSVSHLKPQTKYSIYCYAEGMNKVAMERTVKSTLMHATTKEAPPPPPPPPTSISTSAPTFTPTSFRMPTTLPLIVVPSSIRQPLHVDLQVINLDLVNSTFDRYSTSLYYFSIIVVFVVICCL